MNFSKYKTKYETFDEKSAWVIKAT